MARDSFIFYRSFLKAIEKLPSKQQLALFKAIAYKALDNVDIEIDGLAEGMFSLISPQLEANNQKYEYGKLGGEFGKLGGRPKKEKENPEKTPKGLSDEDHKKTPKGFPEKTPNVNDNVNDNENENVNAGENPIPPKPIKHKHGEYGWIRLSDDEHARHISDYGEKTVSDMIFYIDESAQSKKNSQGWKDWNLVIRRGIRDGWGFRSNGDSGGRYKPETIF